MMPGTPFAGSNVVFEITGLEPWDIVEVTFYEPDGNAAGWVRDDHYVSSRSTEYFLTDEEGNARWVRYGAQDQVGDWTVHVTIDDALRIIRYSYTKFPLPRREYITLGVPLYGCRSDEAVIFFSDSVNFAVTVDMHARLKFAADLLEERLGVRTAEIPVIYMLGNQADFASSIRAAGEEPGWEAGFFRSYGENPGIYIQSDKQQTDLYHLMTHEYVHFLLDEVTDGADLPSWLNEGLAEYYEFEVGRQGDFPDASYRRMLWSGDVAQRAAAGGWLFPLSRLESLREWNSRAVDLVSLQYAQSHMAVRYLSERYGERAPIEIVRQIGMGESLNAAIGNAIGVDYAQFEADFVDWLAAWDDPERAAARSYLRVLNDLDGEVSAILDLRGEVIREWSLHGNRAKAEEGAAELQERAENLVARMRELEPTPYVAGLHDAAVAYFDILESWLAEDLGYFITGQDSKRVAANAMIPEFTYRRVDLGLRLYDAMLILNLYN